MWKLARTLTGYYIAVLVVFAILNMIAWLTDAPPGIVSACFRPAF
jgi:hypothetical protein